MTRSRAILATAALVITALAGCGGNDKPGAAPTPASPATPQADPDRDACHAVSTGPQNPTWADALQLGQIAQTARHANDSRITEAGEVLARTVADVQGGGSADQAQANIDLNEALLKLATACAARFGDGSW